MKKADGEKLLEEELYTPVRDFLEAQGYAVYSEVKYCDVAAVKGDELIIVEMKRSLNLELILQAVNRQKTADSVYVAVPKPKGGIYSPRWGSLSHLLRRLELGLILVTVKKSGSYVEIVFDPSPFDREKSKRSSKKKRHSIIAEIEGRHGDYNSGGSCRKKLMTAYRESAVHIACCLKILGPLSPKVLRALGTSEKKTRDILADNHYGWFERVKKGLYVLLQKGREELEAYPELVRYYEEDINKKLDQKSSCKSE